MTASNSTSLMMCMVLVILGMANVAPAKDPDPAAGGNRIVARDDYEVNPAFLPPSIMQRGFWNMLPPSPKADSPQAKAMADYVATEPMVRDAAVHHSLGNLRADGGDPL